MKYFIYQINAWREGGIQELGICYKSSAKECGSLELVQLENDYEGYESAVFVVFKHFGKEG